MLNYSRKETGGGGEQEEPLGGGQGHYAGRGRKPAGKEALLGQKQEKTAHSLAELPY